MDSKVLDSWTAFCLEVQALEKDVNKNVQKRNCSAGVRVRKGLRALKKHLSALVAETQVADKAVREERKAAAKAKAAAASAPAA